MPETHTQSVTANLQPVGEQPVIVAVADAIRYGIELQAEKAAEASGGCGVGSRADAIRPLYKHCPRGPAACPACVVRKIEYPDGGPLPECRHHERTVMSRVGINRRQHLMLLSTPNPNRLVKPCWPTMVERPIHCATYRLAKLAEPLRRTVYCTWGEHANVLDPYHIENCRKRVQDLRFTRTTTAVEYFTQKQRYAQFRRLKRHIEIGQLRKQIQGFRRKRLAQHTVNILTGLYLHSRAFLLANNVQLLTQHRLRVSQYVLQRLCAYIGYALPKRRSKALFDTFLTNLADNLAVWLSSFASNSGYDIRDEVNGGSGGSTLEPTAVPAAADRTIEQCVESIPIEAYVDYSTDDVSSATCSESELGRCAEGEEEGEWEDEGMTDEGMSRR